jgi:hypothetical protein
VIIIYNRAFEILLGYCNRSFLSKRRYSVGSLDHPTSSIVAHWNNDGRLGAIVCCSCEKNIILFFFGYGDGTFGIGQSYSIGSSSSCPLVGATTGYNKAGLLDLLVVNSNTATLGGFAGYTYMNTIRELTYPTGSNSHP